MITPEQDRILQRLAELAVIAAINKVKSQTHEQNGEDDNRSDVVDIRSSHDRTCNNSNHSLN